MFLRLFLFLGVLIASLCQVASAAPSDEISWSFRGINLKGPRAHVLRAAEELQQINRTEMGERTITRMGKRHFVFHCMDWEDHNRFHRATNHTRHGAYQEPNDWNQKKMNFVLIFDAADRGRELEIEDPSNDENAGTIDFTTSFFRQVLKSEIMLELGSLDISYNYLFRETMKFQVEWKAEQSVTVVPPGFPFIRVQGSAAKVERMIQRLTLIHKNPQGRKLLADMATCGHNLRIYDDKSALGSAGFASAEGATMDVFRPGKGSDAYIRYRFDVPDDGSHQVVTMSGGLIPFLALENIFHELVHAKHNMCGTLARDPEAQAVEEENLFRHSLGGPGPDRDYSRMEDDKQVWFGL